MVAAVADGTVAGVYALHHVAHRDCIYIYRRDNELSKTEPVIQIIRCHCLDFTSTEYSYHNLHLCKTRNYLVTVIDTTPHNSVESIVTEIPFSLVTYPGELLAKSRLLWCKTLQFV